MRHSDCRTLPHLLQQLAGVRRYLSYQDVSNFEILPDTVVHPTIFFQTRLWEQSQTEPDSAAEINEGRVEVIRTLRSAFGEQFVGGLMPTPLAKQAYPDLVLTPDETRPANYVRRSQSSLVVIYTRGLHHSLAFKLAEDLAGSHCIVSEPLRNELPVSLEEGRHYLRYNNPEDCVAQCQRLLADPAMAAQMRHNNWRYYQAEVKPAVRLRKCLEQAFAAHAASYKEIYSSSSCASNKPR